VTDDEEARARFVAMIARRNAIRAKEIAEPEIDWHALAWGRIVRAREAGRNPSLADLLSAISADTTIPESVQDYARRLRNGEAKPTRGAKPRWNLNHRASQRQCDLILVEVFETLRQELLHDPERRGQEITIHDAFVEFAHRGWGGKEAWLGMAVDGDNKAWGEDTARARYFEAKGRLAPAPG
jgi:hypothetical protein